MEARVWIFFCMFLKLLIIKKLECSKLNHSKLNISFRKGLSLPLVFRIIFQKNKNKKFIHSFKIHSFNIS